MSVCVSITLTVIESIMCSSDISIFALGKSIKEKLYGKNVPSAITTLDFASIRYNMVIRY